MCQNIYISSDRELPEIAWDERAPGFSITKVSAHGVLQMLQPILQSNYVYEAFSHTGCSCGLSYASWSKHDQKENHPQRVKDVRDFANYLDTHKHTNTLQIFSSMWAKFPHTYEQRVFKTTDIKQEEFYIDEMVLLKVI